MIDYRKIVSAIEYYERNGFELIEVPWCVEPEANLVTLPQHIDRRLTSTPWGDLIGSAEQGFIDMMIDSLMPKGRYMAISPCFRVESDYTELRRPWFMKLELIDYMPAAPVSSREEIIDISLQFFRQYVASGVDHIIPAVGPQAVLRRPRFTDRGIVDGLYDITTDDLGIELGSYGIREFGHHRWVYGTGIAEPRLSTAIELIERTAG